MVRFITTIAATIALFSAAATGANLGPEPTEVVHLNTNVTVTRPGVRLGDLFTGLTSYQDRVVAQSPRPGQRRVLAPDVLANLARTYSVEWKPGDQFDRAVVFRPGQTVSPTDILASLKGDLILKGMPERFGLKPVGVLPTMVVPAEAMPPVVVRESYFDSATKAFNAVLEIAGSDGNPQFLQLRGSAIPTVSVPVLKAELTRTGVITQDAIEMMDVPEEQIKGDFVTDAAFLIGKTPKVYVQPHRPIRQTDVARLSLVDVPVLRSDMRRDGVIGEAAIMWTTLNAADLPADAVVDKEYLLGKSPRSFVPAGVAIRRGDVLSVRQVSMAVAARDIPNGTVVAKSDINWVSVTDNQLEYGVITDANLLSGRAVTRPIRAGQPLRAIDVVRPKVVARGSLVTIIYQVGGMKLTVQGKAMEDGGVSEAIRVTNIKSQNTVEATVIDSNTVKIGAQQSAMQ